MDDFSLKWSRGPGVNTSSLNKSGQASDPNSDDETDLNGKRRRAIRGGFWSFLV